MLMVPFIMHLLADKGIAPAYLVKVAIATSLATMVFTSLSSVREHTKAGAVRWDLVKSLTPGIVLGALLGAQLVGFAPARGLELLFGAFLLYTAIGMLRAKKPLAAGAVAKSLPGQGGLVRIGALVGLISAMVGAGGGFLTVPYLSGRGVRMQNAVATSAACGIPIALGGALGYIWAGRDLQLAAGTIGYLYLPGLLLISLASVLTAPLGVRTAHRINTAQLKRIFGLMLGVMGAYMLWRAAAF